MCTLNNVRFQIFSLEGHGIPWLQATEEAGTQLTAILIFQLMGIRAGAASRSAPSLKTPTCAASSTPPLAGEWC